MSFRTLALALALSCGAATMMEAAAVKPKSHKVKTIKPKKDKHYKQSKASKVKPRKAPKHR